jgi:hypothetical protein
MCKRDEEIKTERRDREIERKRGRDEEIETERER